jgi:hypothetical protein
MSNVTAQLSSQMEVNVYTDVALQLDPGQSITASPPPTAKLVSSAGVDVSATSLVSPVTVSGTKLVVIVKALTPGDYLLTFTYLPTPPDFAGQQLSAIQMISCRY